MNFPSPATLIYTVHGQVHTETMPQTTTHPIFSLFSSFNLTQRNFQTHKESHPWPSNHLPDSSLAASLSMSYYTPFDHFSIFTKLSECNKTAKNRPITLEALRECEPPTSPHFYILTLLGITGWSAPKPNHFFLGVHLTSPKKFFKILP